MKIRTIEKKKIYRGMVEIKDYELDKAIALGQSVKFIYDGKSMTLTPSRLKKEKIFINTQKSIHNEGQTYAIYGYRWNPTDMVDEQLSLNNTMLKMAGTPAWEELREKLHG